MYIVAIFGLVGEKLKGLVNAESTKEFESQLNLASKDWDDKVIEYFEQPIKQDIITGMLMHLRQNLCIDQFYNNGEELNRGGG